MDMEDMDIMDTMERGKLMLRPLQDISMATLMDMVIMDMEDMDIMDTMERGKLMLRPLQDISMATLMDMVIMDTMERGKLKLPQDIIMVTMDMEDTDTHMVT